MALIVSEKETGIMMMVMNQEDTGLVTVLIYRY